MPESQSTDRLLGTLIAKVDALGEDVRELKEATRVELRELRESHQARLNAHSSRLDALEREKALREGGAKMLTALLAGAVVIGGLIAQLINMVIGKVFPS